MRIECPHCQARVRVEDPDDDTPIRCPECRKKFTPPDPDDDDRPRRGGKKRAREKAEAEEGNNKKGWIIAGGVVGTAAVGGIVAVVLMMGGDKKPAEAANNNNSNSIQPQQPPPPRPQPVVPQPDPAAVAGGGLGKTTNPTIAPNPNPPKKVTPVGPAAVTIPPQYADLFRTPVSAPPRMIRAASLRPSATDLVPDVPTFHSLLQARKNPAGKDPAVAPKAAKLTNEELKRASAFIKVEAGDRSGSGSGFLIALDGQAGLVATNHHVIEAAARPQYGAKPATVTVIFNSGLADEKVGKAAIVAYDPVADLAILRVEAPGPWPKAINPYHTPAKLTEGVAVQFWGFPLGDILATGKRNPEITLGTGTVSSFRYNAGGKLDRVQVNGTINPGNSGGPLVDADGRLVGIVVSRIKPNLGSGIGFAVPVNDLIALLEGRLLATAFIPIGLENNRAKFLVFCPVMDPLVRVDTVFIRRWAGAGGPPEAVRDPLTGYKPFGMKKDGKANLPGVDEFPLKLFKTDLESTSGFVVALGEIDVPQDAAQVQIQVASQTFPNPVNGGKLTAASKPVAYTLSVGDQAVGADARPFNTLTDNLDGLAGQTVVVKGRIAAPPNTLAAVQELVIVSPDGRRPDRVRFLVDAAVATQFDEVMPEDRPLPVRLVCLVGRRGADGFVPVRVARLDFIGRADWVVRTIPAGPGEKADDLAAMNRDPARFAGKTMDLAVETAPLMPRALAANELVVLLSSFTDPRNLRFTISPAMRQRLIEGLGREHPPGAVVPAKIRVTLPDQTAPPGYLTNIVVTRIDFTDLEGNVIKSVE